MFTWIIVILLTPFLIFAIGFLVILAIITSTITSSLIFIRLAFLAIEMVSGLTIESANRLLFIFLERTRIFLTRRQPTVTANNKVMPKKRKLPPPSLHLDSISHKPTVKSTYSTSVPGTPDPESFHHRMAI